MEKSIKDIDDGFSYITTSPIEIKGDLYDELEEPIGKFSNGIFDDDNIVIEIKSSTNDYKFRSNNMKDYDKCEYCNKMKNLKFKCGCGKGWCCEQCKKMIITIMQKYVRKLMKDLSFQERMKKAYWELAV